MTSACPDLDALQAYLLGHTTSAGGSIDDHLGDCEQCLERLQALSDRTTPLAARLRRQQEIVEAPLSPVVSAAVERVKLLRALPPAEAPQELREYRLLERIGEGGMGQVYRAVHSRLGKTVAVKLLTASRLTDPTAVARFEREMKAVGALTHPNIVVGTDAGEADGRHYLVMEHVPGMDLARLVKANGPLPVRSACEVARQAAEGLAYAHGQGLVHRDVKPSNLMLTPEGTVKILDLGLALLKGEAATEPALDGPRGWLGEEPTTVTGEKALTSVSCVMGTNDYMAPEQWQDSHGVGAPADLYSLGCTLFFLLTGRPPFDAPGQLGLLAKCQAHLREAPPPLRRSRPDVPARLEKVVLRLLAKSPDQRYPDAAAVAGALKPFCANADLKSLLDAEAGRESLRRQRGRPSRLTLLLAVGLGLAGLVAVAFFARPPKAREEPEPPAKVSEARPAPEAGSIPLTTEEAIDLRKRWADHLGMLQSEPNSLGMDMCLIPPGAFDLDKGLRVRITQPYRMARTEVTVGQFRAFVEATGHLTEPESNKKGGYLRDGVNVHSQLRDPSFVWRTPGYAGVTDDHPVTQVAWADADAFCRWLSAREKKTYRLPTEAEWKWACRAGSRWPYVLGPDLKDLHRHAWVNATSGGHPRPVAGLSPNAWGLFDMLGNADEMVLDWHAPLPKGELADPAGPPEGLNNRKVVVGPCCFSASGAWTTRGGQGVRTASAEGGFRVLCEVGPAEGPRPIDAVRPPIRP